MKQLNDILDLEAETRAARRFRMAHGLMLGAGLVAAVSASMPETERAWAWEIDVAIGLPAVFFFAEYFLRIATATFHPSEPGETTWHILWSWMTSPQGVFDAAGALPFLAVLTDGGIDRPVRLLAVLWAFKLFRYSPGARILGRVIRYAWEPLVSVSVAFVVILLTASALMHYFEADLQPKTYGSIPQAMWWTIVTLTTTGYGDVTPVTSAGRVLASVVMVSGIAMFALWAGILANAFAHEVKRREFLRTWNMITQVPMFQNLGTEAIADISRVLRSREFSRGAVVFRRNERGECMYFIVAGTVEIQVPGAPVTLGPGAFLGELALITGEHRSATAVATQAAQLLALDIADFRELVARHPDLAGALHAEADRRLAVQRASAIRN